MTEALAIEIGREGLIIALKISSPILGVGLIVGLTIGIFQAVTQIHELTLTFVPKVFATALILIFFMPWMLQEIIGFTTRLIMLIATF